MMQTMDINHLGGIQIEDPELLKRAQEADLITLPEDVDGTNCFNCRYIYPPEGNEEMGNCVHPSVDQPVSHRMCCALWDNKGALRSWDEA